MKEVTVEVTLPQNTYEELRQVADASSWTMEEVVRRTIHSGMPPVLSKVPAAFHEKLLALNELDDQELWRIVVGDSPMEEELDNQQRKADFPTLRRSYAFALLKWRGHPVPLPYEIFME